MMAEGFVHGRFSSWFFLDDYYPETLRTPGYPLFLLALKRISDSLFFIQLVQLVFYFASLHLAYKTLTFLCPQNKKAHYVFLLLTAFNIQLPFYSGYISAELLSIYLTILYVYVLVVKKHSIINALLLGLIAAMLFQFRPAFLLFPLLITFYSLLFRKPLLKYFALHFTVFFVSLLPFSYWNYTNHGVFKPTPIEGGAGVAHIGYWTFKLPAGYHESYYWGNIIVHDLTNPMQHHSTDSTHVAAFEHEWYSIHSELQLLLSKKDHTNLATMHSEKNPGIFPLYNSSFTNKREELLWKEVKHHAKEEPWFYLSTRVFSFFRFYFTGINSEELSQQTSHAGQLKVVYPFLITFTCILGGMMLSAFFIIRKKFKVQDGVLWMFMLALYQGAIHIPFVIQARYTIPVHLCILILVAVIVTRQNIPYTNKVQ